MNTNDQLKPCPFCGGEPKIYTFANEEYYVKCNDCFTRTDFYDSENHAIKAWNRRANTND